MTNDEIKRIETLIVPKTYYTQRPNKIKNGRVGVPSGSNTVCIAHPDFLETFFQNHFNGKFKNTKKRSRL